MARSKKPKTDTANAKQAKDPMARRKKIGQRVENLVEKLTPMQIEDEKEKVISLLRSKGELAAKKKTANAEFKLKADEIEEQIAATVMVVNTARRETEVTIEEWLTHGNEVIRVRADTGEQIGRRTARVEELQMEIFEGADDDEKPEVTVTQGDVEDEPAFVPIDELTEDEDEEGEVTDEGAGFLRVQETVREAAEAGDFGA